MIRVCSRYPCYIVSPLRFFSARSPSLRLMNATKPQFLCLAFSSSLRGHIIFILAKGPYLPNISINCCSVICKDERSVKGEIVALWRGGRARYRFVHNIQAVTYKRMVWLYSVKKKRKKNIYTYILPLDLNFPSTSLWYLDHHCRMNHL